MSTRVLFLLFFLIVIDIYSYQWLRQLISPLEPVWKSLLQVFFWSGSAITLVLTITYALNVDFISPHILIYLRAWAFISYFAKFISIPIVLIDDLRRMLGYLIKWLKPDYVYSTSRMEFLSKVGAFAAGVPFFTLLYGMARNAYRYQIHRIKIPIKNLPPALENLRIVQISDIHSGSFTSIDQVKKSISMVTDLQPDILFFTGDLVNYKADEIIPYIDIFQKMKGKYGSFSVFGNHDYGDYAQWANPSEKITNLNTLKKHHATIGWNLLLNQNETIEIHGEKISIIGVENFSASRRFTKYGNLSKAYEGLPLDSLKLLLSHDPSHWDFEVNKSYKDIALTCSGHTHGFQFGIEIPGFMKWSPSQYIYKEWAGLYSTNEKQHLYVNRGFGFLGYPGRVGILPEITLLELISA
ncbi:MAG: metallophosphoesterase [Saprospiraceae bacterium]